MQTEVSASDSEDQGLVQIKRALISVSDKEGIVGLARFLHERGVLIISTGGTANAIRANGIDVEEVSMFTGFPEMLDGRLKTLHPNIHGGLLARRDISSHMKDIGKAGIKPIDLVVVNLYPFEETIAKPGCTLADAIENIDIGGPTMLRSAAKNYASVTVVCDPSDYIGLMEQMEEHDNQTTLDHRFQLAVKVFDGTSDYDAAIRHYLASAHEAAMS